jgi:glycosyltransferase involved in cell wall biosynthesis
MPVVGKLAVAGFAAERAYLSRQVRSFVREKKIDLVESYDWSGPLWSHPRVPLVVRMHGASTAHAHYQRHNAPRWTSYVERRNVMMADKLIAVSEHIKQETLGCFGLRTRPCTVIYNGVDTAFFSPDHTTRAAKQVLYVGTVSERKGLNELFTAIPLVLDAVPRTEFLLVGRISQGEHAKPMSERLLSTLPEQARSQVRFLGPVPHEGLAEHYRRATLLVFPSRAEALGLVPLEAMSCGCPVVATNRASGPELVEDGVSGLIADVANPHDLASKIVCLLRDDEAARRMGVKAQERTLSLFTIERTVRESLRVYEKALAVRRQSDGTSVALKASSDE